MIKEENEPVENIDQLKKEISSLKRRLTSALKQRDEWAMKYARVMEEKKS